MQAANPTWICVNRRDTCTWLIASGFNLAWLLLHFEVLKGAKSMHGLGQNSKWHVAGSIWLDLAGPARNASLSPREGRKRETLSAGSGRGGAVSL
jgi:hypothetical protein